MFSLSSAFADGGLTLPLFIVPPRLLVARRGGREGIFSGILQLFFHPLWRRKRRMIRRRRERVRRMTEGAETKGDSIHLASDDNVDDY